MNNKGDTLFLSVKQFITHKSMLKKNESFVKGLLGECSIQQLVEIWLDGITDSMDMSLG